MTPSLYVCVVAGMCVCVCVCVWEREREIWLHGWRKWAVWILTVETHIKSSVMLYINLRSVVPQHQIYWWTANVSNEIPTLSPAVAPQDVVQHDHLRCHRWRQSWHYDDIPFWMSRVNFTNTLLRLDTHLRTPKQSPYNCSYVSDRFSLHWRHNERDGVSNCQRLDCLLNHLFRRRSKKTSKFRVTGLCERNPPVAGGFSSQRASNAGKNSIWWRYYMDMQIQTESRTVFCCCFSRRLEKKLAAPLIIELMLMIIYGG